MFDSQKIRRLLTFPVEISTCYTTNVKPSPPTGSETVSFYCLTLYKAIFCLQGLKANVLVPFEEGQMKKPADLVNEDSSNRKRSSSLTEQVCLSIFC